MTEDALKAYLLDDDAIPVKLRETMAYSLFAGGKRLRPALVLASCELCGGEAKTALPFACGIEMIHTYSLIHDDLPAMDNDDFRRGKPTLHKQFGEDQAILTGDALLHGAFEIMLDGCHDFTGVNAVRRIAHASGMRGMSAGQWVDVTLTGTGFDEATMRYIHLHKTADLIRGAIGAGADVAGASKEMLARLDTYGQEIGYTFQIVDDVLDVEGDSAELGKRVGSDEGNHKTTFVTLFGPDGAKEQARLHTARALEMLEPFAEKGNFLRELALFLRDRKH
ncbi:MAG: polyprenyl synthetase family protein [Clostridia bacterium]|nr:polyprenyl synthetase family protein [Clostridia bacterium]